MVLQVAAMTQKVKHSEGQGNGAAHAPGQEDGRPVPDPERGEQRHDDQPSRDDHQREQKGRDDPHLAHHATFRVVDRVPLSEQAQAGSDEENDFGHDAHHARRVDRDDPRRRRQVVPRVVTLRHAAKEYGKHPAQPELLGQEVRQQPGRQEHGDLPVGRTMRVEPPPQHVCRQEPNAKSDEEAREHHPRKACRQLDESEAHRDGVTLRAAQPRRRAQQHDRRGIVEDALAEHQIEQFAVLRSARIRAASPALDRRQRRHAVRRRQDDAQGDALPEELGLGEADIDPAKKAIAHERDEDRRRDGTHDAENDERHDVLEQAVRLRGKTLVVDEDRETKHVQVEVERERHGPAEEIVEERDQQARDQADRQRDGAGV